MICKKKKSSDTRVLYKKSYSLQILRDPRGMLDRESWDQEDIAHCVGIGE